MTSNTSHAPKAARLLAGLAAAALLATSCAGAGRDAPATPAGSASTSPAASGPAPAAPLEAPVVQIHDVRDLVTPPGETAPDTDRTEQLAAELRESLTSVGGAAADRVEITALGGDLIVRAPRGAQAQIRAALTARREQAVGGAR